MKKIKTLFFFAFAVLLFHINPLSASSLLIKDVNIIDGTGSGIKTEMDVLVEAGRIKEIVPSGGPSYKEDAEVIHGESLYLIPGLWDMHVHWYDENYLKLFIANGVTGVRQMWGTDIHYQWRSKENSTSFIGPKQLIASVIIDGNPKTWPNSIEVTNAAEARDQVRFFKKKGADFIKIYNNLNRETYFAIADESKKLGIPFVGHVPISVSLTEASDAGQSSMEHMLKIERGLIDKDLFDKLKMNHTWQSPTLTVLRNNAYLDERREKDQERLLYLPRSITDPWLKRTNASKRQQWFLQEKFIFRQEIVGEMHSAGVKILAGTDVLNPFCFPGFSLHDELELLVEAGLSPMDALQSATYNAAQYSGRLSELGTVEQGKIADLVLLTKNPLEDIRNTTSIAAVILNGVLYNREALDAMLIQMQEQANLDNKK